MDLENNWSCFSLQQPFTSWKTITRPLLPKLNKPSLIRLFSQVSFSKLLHCSCSSPNFFQSFLKFSTQNAAESLKHSFPTADQPNPSLLLTHCRKGFVLVFHIFHFFPHRLWFSTSPSSFSGILLQNHVSVMALGGILNAFLCYDTAEVCDSWNEGEKSLPGATQMNVCNLFRFSKLAFKTSRF